jgi:hypothetical protein
MPKSNRLARRARRSFALEEQKNKEMDSSLRWNDGQNEELDSGFRRNDQQGK